MTAGTLKYGELFAGAGGASLGWDRAGWTPAFHAEIDPAARRTLKAHWPDVPLYGDVTTLRAEDLLRECGPIDLLSGGSPCQDLSLAGRRAGIIDGARSNLFFTQVELWRALGAEYCLWENVVGALSSSQGEDFRYVLSAFVGDDVGRILDRKGGVAKWPNAGVVSGPAGIAAWRVLDAQYWGVPQRRRRVFVLASRTGVVDPAEVLLEFQGVSWNSPPGGATGEGTAEGAGVRAPASGGIERGGSDSAHHLTFYHTNRQPEYGNNVDLCSTIKVGSGGGGNPPAVLAFQERGREGGRNLEHQEDLAYCLCGSQGGSLQRGRTIVAYAVCENQRAEVRLTEEAATLNLGGGKPGQALPVVLTSDQELSAEERDWAPAESTEQRVARMQAFGDYEEDGTASCIKARDYKDATDLVYTVNNDSRAAYEANLVTPLRAGDRAQSAVAVGVPRRLLPVECERLMGWPDNWTLVPDEKGKLASDAVRYRQIGNGVVSHCVQFIGERLLAAHSAWLALEMAEVRNAA